MKNSIAAKLVLIMKDCSYIQKSGFNEYHHYKFASASDVLEKVNASLVRNNVASIVVADLEDMRDTVNQTGKTEHLATVRTNLTLIDCDSGESLTVVGLGSGQDIGDKAVMKAQTASLKYAYMLSLAIATGDDPEADTETDIRNAPVFQPINKPHVPDEGDIVCSDCGAQITKGVLKVSVSKYGRPLCMKCQRSQHAA
jgi:hypothetical protein